MSNTRRSSSAQRRLLARSAGQSSEGAAAEDCADPGAVTPRAPSGTNAAPPPPEPSPRGIGAVVAHAGLVVVGHVIGPAGEELERVHAMDADIGAARGVGGELNLGALGVIAQAVLGDRGAGAVAGDAREARAIIAGDHRADMRAESRVRPGEHGGSGVLLEPATCRRG